MINSEKINAEDLEEGDPIWVKDESGEYKMKLVLRIGYNLNNKTIITFDDNTTIFVNNKKKFELV